MERKKRRLDLIFFFLLFLFFSFFLHLPFLSQTIIMVLKQNIIKLRLLSFSHEFVYIYIYIYI